MPKFLLKKASNPEKLKVYIPDALFKQLSQIANHANCSLDEVVSQALAFSLRYLREEEPLSKKASQ